jgi:hypothetical protein
MEYICRTCHQPFNFTDPIEPERKLALTAQKCLACRKIKTEVTNAKWNKISKRRKRAYRF